MGKYLVRCLQSIVDAQLSDMEIICVNDGSEDDTIDIFNQFKYSTDGIDKYPWLKLINQSNQGVSVARNSGLNIAQGEYVSFVDPDDIVTSGGMKAMLEYTERNPDWIFGSVELIDKNREHKHYLLSDEFVVGNKQSVHFIFEQMDWINWAGPWAKLYRRKLIEKNNLRFDPKLKKHQDGDFNCRFMRHVESIATTKEIVYVYEICENSNTAGFRGERDLVALEGLRNALFGVYNQYFDGSSLKELKYNYNRQEAWQIMTYIYNLYLNHNAYNKYEKLKQLWAIGQRHNDSFTEFYTAGLPLWIKRIKKCGFVPLHVLLLLSSNISFVRKKMK